MAMGWWSVALWSWCGGLGNALTVVWQRVWRSCGGGWTGRWGGCGVAVPLGVARSVVLHVACGKEGFWCGVVWG